MNSHTVQALKNLMRSIISRIRISRYIRSGRKPWTVGYSDYREIFIRDALDRNDLVERFRLNHSLPDRYGYRIDERAVEYPWLFSRLDVASRLMLDAGSALNYRYLLFNRWLQPRSLVIYTLSPEQVVRQSNISYIYGELRNTILKSECFDEIVCISTLEHIGMNNQFLYSKNNRYNEFEPDSYLIAIREFKRLLKPDGKLFVTVPYGRYQNLGWQQQFDHKMVGTIVDGFTGTKAELSFFRYVDDGWQVSNAADCSECTYFDIHQQTGYELDYLAAARAVACIEITK